MKPYTHFTLAERESLRIMLSDGKSMRAMARILGRNVSSVSRELKRNCSKRGYNAWWSTSLYIFRRKKCRRKERFLVDNELITFVGEGLSKYWSPEIITIKWKQLHLGAKLSHSTIYRALKRKLIAGYRAEAHLRRRNRLKYKKGDNRTIRPENEIADRPVSANNRDRIGDWECDTVHGSRGKGFLVTCVDRKSRYLAAAVSPDRTPSNTNAAIFQSLAAKPVHTLTFDRGSEFAGFREIETALGTTVYFADPHSPWQRGSNENINGLLRFFFPRGTSFLAVDQEYLDTVLYLINSRPRKCLGWLSPADVFFSKCCT